MATWVAFLRAVNVGRRPYPMAELRAALAAAGVTDVETHLQTGNVRFGTRMRSRDRIAAALEEAMATDRGFAVPVVLLTPAELVQVALDAAEVGEPVPAFGHYVELLARPVGETERRLIEGQDFPGQRYVVRDRAVHLLFDLPYHEAKGPTAAVRRAMGVSTNRNLTVVRALAEKWGET